MVVAKATAIVAAVMDMEEVEVGVVTLPGKLMEKKRLGELLLQNSQEILMGVDQCKGGDVNCMYVCVCVCACLHD